MVRLAGLGWVGVRRMAGMGGIAHKSMCWRRVKARAVQEIIASMPCVTGML